MTTRWRRQTILLGAGLCVIIAASVAYSSVRRAPRPVVFERPELRDRLTHTLSCDDDAVWLGSFQRGDRLAYVSRLTRASGWQERTLGHGVVTGLSRVGSSIWTVLVPGAVAGAFDETGGDLFQSTDGGQSWLPVRSVRGVIGVAFADAASGYAWSNTTLFATRDGGAHWSALDLSPAALERSTGVNAPFLDDGGNLWAVAAVAPQKRIESVLLRFDREPAAAQVSAWQDTAVQGTALRRDGSLVYAEVDVQQDGFSIIERSPSGEERLVRKWEKGSGYLRGRGDRLVVDVIGGPWPKGFFGSLPTKRWVSVDGGRRWSEQDTTGEGFNQPCLADHGYWVVQRASRIAYFPFPERP